MLQGGCITTKTEGNLGLNKLKVNKKVDLASKSFETVLDGVKEMFTSTKESKISREREVKEGLAMQKEVELRTETEYAKQNVEYKDLIGKLSNKIIKNATTEEEEVEMIMCIKDNLGIR